MISIIIPAYNEQENIPRIEEELIPVMDNLGCDYELVIVNDGSHDGTEEEIFKLKSKFDNINLVRHNRNKGLGCAVRTGIEHIQGELVITIDADFTFHPRDIPRLLEKYGGTKADCVIGSHLHPDGNVDGVITYRLWLSRVVNRIYALLMGGRISSYSSIFRLYKAGELKKLDLKSTGFNINAEILFKLLQNGGRVVEVPVALTTRKYGTSKLRTGREIKNHLILLSKILLWKLGIK